MEVLWIANPQAGIVLKYPDLSLLLTWYQPSPITKNKMYKNCHTHQIGWLFGFGALHKDNGPDLTGEGFAGTNCILHKMLF